jgi:hypothetical protein
MSDNGQGNGDGGVPVGDIQFYKDIIPPLDDGDYTLIATQTLSGLPGEPDPKIDPVTVKFSIRGPRFTLNPADIHSVFPPSGASTAYEGQLPHVVVSRKTLPWERELEGQPLGTPWLGLLTIDEGDDGGIPKLNSGAVGDLLVDAGKLPPATLGPKITMAALDAGESADDACSYIDVPADLFAAISPRLAELPFLAHARGVNTGNKPIEGILADGIYSVLIGNRVAHASKLNGAFLVSFEGFEELLVNGTVPSGISTVRLAVLHSWTFQMSGQDPFDALMSADNSGLLAIPSTEPPTVSSTGGGQPISVGPPDDPSSSSFAKDTVSYALQSGYAALAHDLRQGDETFSWYRGPLIPYLSGLVVSKGTVPVFRTADDLLRYDPVSGLFDTSYAAAFQLGRLLALQNEAFLTSLRTYLHQVKGQALRLANRKALVTSATSPLELPTTQPELLRNGVVLDAAVRWLAANGANALNAAVGGRTDGGEGGS